MSCASTFVILARCAPIVAEGALRSRTLLKPKKITGYIPLNAIIFKGRIESWQKLTFDLTATVKSNSDFRNNNNFLSKGLKKLGWGKPG